MSRLVIGVSIVIGILLIGGELMAYDPSANSKDANRPIAGNEAFIIPEPDLPKLEADALSGSQEAAFRLYLFYEFVRLDPKQSLFWVTISAENGHPVGQYNLGVKLTNDKDLRNRQRALFWLRRSADQGNQRAVELLHQLAK